MSEENQKKFFVDRAKQGRANCKKCKQKLEKGALRLAKAAPNPFGEGVMKMWHHLPCMFEVFSRQRATTAKIETPDDIEGWDDLDELDQKEILSHLPNCKDWKVVPKTASKDSSGSKEKAEKKSKGKSEEKKVATASKEEPHKDDSFREFRRMCALIAAEDSYTGKTAIVKDWFSKGSDGDSFKGDLLLWCRLLLPGVVKRVYNLESKQLIKLFSRILGADQDEMLEHLEQGDVADTITVFFEKSKRIKSAKKSTITMQDVDKFLEGLSGMTKEDEQTYHFTQMAKNCTLNDLKMIIRLVKHDLRIKAGPKHILEAVHPEAYQAFQMSRDLKAVLSKVAVKSEDGSTKKTSLNISATLMTPVLPMLAEACKSVEAAMKKCRNGMYSEIKYDGERVQVHKRGSEFKYFSRSLKPVMPHKVRNLEDYIPQAFPHGKDLILDSEVLLVDVNTGKPLPFGSLGKHKQNEFQDAQVCLFVFDCIYYNGEPLFNKPIMERRQILLDNMKEIPNRVVFSQMEEIHDPKDLRNMIEKVLKLGLEGLVLKDLMSTYEPGKRHWLKVKKDYLFGGAMADSVDLVVLGAWFGTGQKGGMMSVFLMGCYDPHRRKWCTVTKVHTGHDDKTLDRLQKELDMVKISKDPSKVPDWLLCTKTMIPDFVARDPKAQPVWEITGAEFTQHEVHTAAGISVRFPRVTKIRSDKNWETATSLPELKKLFKTSKDNVDFSLHASDETSTASSNATRKGTSSRPSSAASSKPSTSTVDSGSDTEVEEYIPVKIRKTEKPDPKLSPQKAMKPTATKAKREAVVVTPKKKRKEEEYVLKDPLPDIFTGVKLVLPRRLDSGDRRLLERYLVAYGGILLDEDEDEVGEATHVIHMGGEPDENVDCNTWPRSARHVQLDWLWASIKLGNLQDTRRYAVTMTPTKL